MSRETAMLRLGRVVLAVAASAMAVRGVPDVSRLQSAWTEPGVRIDTIAALVAGSALWCVAIWVLIVVVLGVLARTPGRIGRWAAGAARAAVPRVLRAAVLGSVVSGIALAPATMSFAVAMPGPSSAASPTSAASTGTDSMGPTRSSPGSATATGAPVWPTDGPSVSPSESPSSAPMWPTSSPTSPTSVPSTGAGTSTSSPSPPSSPTPSSPATPSSPLSPNGPPAGSGGPVRVAAGDSLWAIAAAQWRAAYGSEPTADQIAAAWPRWYEANRALIGDDPGLIHPGQILQPPP